jgi:hypothetical protein
VAATASADLLDYAPADRMRNERSPSVGVKAYVFPCLLTRRFGAEIVPSPGPWKLMQPMHLCSLTVGCCMEMPSQNLGELTCACNANALSWLLFSICH